MFQWMRSEYGSYQGDPSSTNKIRANIRHRLYPQYTAMHRAEFPEGIKPMSESKFYNEMKDGFMDGKSEMCCCGQCVDGWHYIGLMKDLVEDSTLGLQNPKAKAKQVDAIHHFYNYDYRWKHLKPSSKVSTHCCNHALASGSACLTSACDHTHENTCTACNM